jgi:tetratricopeptide (TPR) repeat protein
VLALAGVAVAAVATGFLVKVDPVGTFAEGIEAYESVESPDPDAALRSFDRLLQYYPSDHYLHLYAAHSASAAGDYELALKEYRKSETGYGSTPRHRPIAVLTGIAAVDYLKGDYAAARDELDGALSQWNSAEATGRLALVNLRLGKTKQAADLANSAIDLGDKSCIPQIVLAQAQTITNRPDDADEHISKVTEMNPGHAKRLADGPGDWSRAIERLTPMDLRMPLKMLQAKRVGWSSSTRQNSFI